MEFRIRPATAALAVAFSSTAITTNALAETTADSAATLGDVVVSARRPRPLPAASPVDASALSAATSDTASLLRDVPGVSLYGAGGLSSLPAIHGLADDRLRIKVDGMDQIASCPNHMNPPLSYLDPAMVGDMKVYTGIVPVSVGGDSIGGAIVAESAAPTFAAPGQGLLTSGEIGASYRSNGDAVAGHVSATAATENLSIRYTGSGASANNYRAGGDFKTSTATGRSGRTLGLDEVGSTAYENRSHLLDLAFRSAKHLFEAKLGYQEVPYQLYPNQRMDMLDNEQKRVSLRYLGQFDWGNAEVRAYHEDVRHFMDFGPDKKKFYTAGNGSQGMPMRTRGETGGVSGKFTVNLGPDDLLRVGAEAQRYTLDDWWPPVIGSMGMGPNDFLNIHNGRRDRAALFGEWEKRLNTAWTSLVGVRYEHVTTDADPVHGYNSSSYPVSTTPNGMMNQSRDAASFNKAERRKTDDNWDLSALARYTLDERRDLEFGLARKVRSPNLYERYTWSTANMMAVMNNFVGDGNGYVGNLDLKPETAYTATTTLDWHAADRAWQFRATPFYTYVDNYIDAVQWNGSSDAARSTPLADQYVVLKYMNQSAELYGLDLSGRLPLGRGALGEIGLSGLVNYTHGENRDSGGNLYNIMPLNARLTLTQTLGGWRNAIELVAARGKHDVSAARNEIRTHGYSLTNLRASYGWRKLRVDFGVENLFDRNYELPLGGAYTGQGSTMSINPGDMPWGTVVPGRGRSFYAGFDLSF